MDSVKRIFKVVLAELNPAKIAQRWIKVAVSGVLALLLLGGCALPQVSAEDRLF